MKRRAVLALFLVGLMLGPVCEALAAFKLSYFYVQKRLYENGKELNRVSFQFADEQGNINTEDLLQRAVLRNAKGKIVPLKNLKFSPAQGVEASYDGNKSLWLYNSNMLNWNAYKADIEDPLVPGLYTLTAKYAGTVSTAAFQFNGVVSLPIIKSSSIKTTRNKDGSALITFSVPPALYTLAEQGVQTSVRAQFDLYNGETYIAGLEVRLPSHLGKLFLPAEVVNTMSGMADTFKFRIQLRTNDNNNRTYSNDTDISLQ